MQTLTATLRPTALVLGIACGTAAAFCWAAGFVAARHGILAGLKPADIALHRFVWAGLVLLPGALANGFADARAIGWGRALTLTVVAGPLQALISYLGFTLVPLGHGVVIQPASSALAGLILAAWALGEPTTARRMLGAAAIVVGLSLFGAEATSTIGRHGLLGDFLFLAAGIAWGVFGILLRHWRIDGTRAASVICVLALVLYAPAHGLIWGYANLLAAGLKENLLQMLAQGLLAGAGAIYLFARAVTLLGASRALIFPALVPAFGIAIGYLALGEVPTVYQLAGLAVVAIGFRLALKQ
ncbi:MAG TPA: DMT family transporter [Xanthobacteraceae bacterium]|nr:DMT family transporter [Xanthobacteraceae bacterium]